MLKCLAVICILGLAVNAEWESATQAGKKSQRMNLLSKTVGARMLAGTNGQMDSTFQSITPTGNNQQFVPIPRQNTAGISAMQQPTPNAGGQAMDNSLTGGQQLTPEQIQQLHQFLTAQTQSQQQQQQQTQFGQQPTGQPQSFAQTQQQQQQPTTMGRQMTTMGQQPQSQSAQIQQNQQMFRMDSTGVTGMNTPTGMDKNSFAPTTGDQQTMNGQFGQGRMMQPTAGQTPVTGAAIPSAQTVPTNTQANKPSALEQQLLDQQILTQKLKEQLLQLQQQQKQTMTKTQTMPTTPNFPATQQTGVEQPTGFGPSATQQKVAQEQLTQEQTMQRMTAQQQQQQQQQLLDQINKLNQMNQQQGRTIGGVAPSVAQPVQTPGFGGMQQPMMQQPMMQQPITNSSRMMMGGMNGVQPQQPQPTNRPVFQQGRITGGDICASAKPGELMPHPLDETQFLVCNELGEITLMDCPNHTVFNPHLKLCDLTSEMPLLCKANPCLNGAKCVEISPIQFRCECPQGFSGKTCEKFDTCMSSRPCGSDGVCLSFALGSPIPHVCLCNGGRSVGLTCDKVEQNPCTISGSSTKLMPVNFNRAVFAHCEGARPHFKFCQPPLLFSAGKQACEWSHV